MTAIPSPKPLRAPHPNEAIEWREYLRIPPGQYLASCYWAKRYRDPGMRRWTCLLRWDVLSHDLLSTIAQRIPLWFALGEGEKPRASRRGKYLREWVRANGGPPGRGDRLSPNVFTRRVARVEIGDTNSPVPYSVVKRILQWETGPLCHSVSKSTSQDGPEGTPRSNGGSEQ
jgi:hypothetical protein